MTDGKCEPCPPGAYTDVAVCSLLWLYYFRTCHCNRRCLSCALKLFSVWCIYSILLNCHFAQGQHFACYPCATGHYQVPTLLPERCPYASGTICLTILLIFSDRRIFQGKRHAASVQWVPTRMLKAPFPVSCALSAISATAWAYPSRHHAKLANFRFFSDLMFS